MDMTQQSWRTSVLRSSRQTVKENYDRQKGRCAGNCGPDGKGRILDLDLFEVDHVVPRSKGGEDVDNNLQLLCPTCNRRKGSRTMKYLYFQQVSAI